jgi:hypothetical protein
MDPEGTEEDSYRYDVLQDCDLGWLDNLCALGFNLEAGGVDKFVIIPPDINGHVLIIGF